ncbi:MAG: hypothetical protein CFE21_15440 [Bacteroidetes bacterium B1(2017)]|nr:MAG: hypothetical protein CFE21_15440 [Bacteroidetes bacterium B1(2017)]
MKKISTLVVSSVATLLPFLGMAHPGHGETEGFTITHYFVEPTHAVVLGAVLACGGIFYLYMRSKKQSENN